MNSHESNKIRINKAFHRTDPLDYPLEREEERRRNATSKVQKEVEKHPFSKVYSKQYPTKLKRENLKDN